MRRIGKGADRLDGLHAGSFLRSDANDTASGQLTFSFDDTTDDFSQLYIRGASTHSGITVNPPASKQAHYRFQTNGTNKWQIRAPFQDGAEAALKIYSFSSNADKFVFNHDGSASFNGGTVYTSANSTIPTNNNQLTNGAGYITGSYIGQASNNDIGFASIRYNQASGSAGTTANAYIGTDPRWNESTYNANLGTLHIYAQTAAGTNWGQTGLALYSGSAYQYFHTQASQNHLFINNSKVWTAGNDGSGSGLDADTCDGQHLGTSANPTFGKIHFDGAINNSGGGAWMGRNHAYDTVELLGYGAEFMIGAQSQTIHINYRTCNNGGSNQTPINWYWRAGSSSSFSNHYFGNLYSTNNTVWHAGNDGSGSGLDADTVDGIQGSNFLRSDTSDEFNGTLTIKGYSQSGGQNRSQAIYIGKDNGASDTQYFTMGWKANARSGEVWHTQSGNGFYIEAGSSEAGGFALDEDGMHVYSSGDGGQNFRVIDKDADAVQFQVGQGAGDVYVRNRLHAAGASLFSGSAQFDGIQYRMNADSCFHGRIQYKGGISTSGTTMFQVPKNDWNNKQAAIWEMLGAENNRNQMHRIGSLHANYYDGWSLTTWNSHDQGNGYGNATVSVDGSGNLKMHAPIISMSGELKLIEGIGF